MIWNWRLSPFFDGLDSDIVTKILLSYLLNYLPLEFWVSNYKRSTLENPLPLPSSSFLSFRGRIEVVF